MTKIKQFKISDLSPAGYNPRVISDEAMAGLTASLARFGCVEPIVVNIRGSKRRIVGGHQRAKALVEMHGSKHKASCVCVDLKPADEKLLNIALNNPQIQGDFSEDLAALIDKLRGQVKGDDLINMRIEDLRAELGQAEIEGKIPDDDIPKPPKKAKTKKGDLWLLGKHRLLCGDSTKEGDVKRLMAGKKADMVFTDPPYGACITGLLMKNAQINRTKHWDMIEGDQFENEELQQFLELAFANFDKITNDGAGWYIWHAMLSQGFFSAAAAAAANLILNRQIIWVKPVLILAFGDYHWRHELCFYGWRKGKKAKWYGPTNETTVWEIDFDGNKRLPNQKRLHVTQKPVGLAERAIKNSSCEGDIVLDGFLGSGSTLIACEKLNRKCYGLEIEPVFCDVIVKRWEQWTGKKGKLAAGGSKGRVKGRSGRTRRTMRPKSP